MISIASKKQQQQKQLIIDQEKTLSDNVHFLLLSKVCLCACLGEVALWVRQAITVLFRLHSIFSVSAAVVAFPLQQTHFAERKKKSRCAFCPFKNFRLLWRLQQLRQHTLVLSVVFSEWSVCACPLVSIIIVQQSKESLEGKDGSRRQHTSKGDTHTAQTHTLI